MAKLIFSTMDFIRAFTKIEERQFQNENKAARFILNILKQHNIDWVTQDFKTLIPKVKHASLTIDGKKLSVISTSLKSGTINNNYQLISSLISSQKFIDEPNINFNPRCKGISRSNHYFAPSFAVAYKDIKKICCAKTVKGIVKVKPLNHNSTNILVGNIINPVSVLFCHYDSYGPGASDNASGVAILLELIINHSETLKNTLYVLAGNEELSYDYPIYWGHGYRVFEKKFYKLLNDSQRILVIDSLGNGPTILYSDPNIVKLGFPIINQDQFANKITMVAGDFNDLMEVYHSSLDTISKLNVKYIDQGIKLILKRILF